MYKKLSPTQDLSFSKQEGHGMYFNALFHEYFH